jgi:hypothetical protein
MPNTYTVTYVYILSRAAWYDYRPHVACVYLKIGAEGRMGRKQGDQIGRFFLLLGDFFTMINVLKIREVAQILGLLFFHGTSF